MYKVVVVDDEVLVRKGIIKETDWASLNCQVAAEASDGEEALRVIKESRPDIVIADIRMPGIDGIEMLRRLRAEQNQVRVIFLTAFSEFAYAREAVRLYAADYILKPFPDGELESAVQKLVNEMDWENGRDYSAIRSGNKSSYVSAALKYMAECHCEPGLTVRVMAKELGVSEGHLSRMFRKETGCTIAGYLIRLRVQTAGRLLDDCRNKVYEVAEQVGYRDVAYFSNIFKKIVGMTPTEYQNREKYQK